MGSRTVKTKVGLIAAASLAALLTGSCAQAATTLAPAVLSPGGSVAIPDFPDGVALLAAQAEPFGSDLGPAGVLKEYVVTDSLVNPFGVNGLIFVFQLSLSSGDVAKVSLPGYAGLDTAVKSCNDVACIEGTGDPPDTATRSANGDVVSFLFSTPITGPSAGFSIYTNALGFTDPPSAMIIDAAGDISLAPTFAPAGVPEPSTWAMMLLGLAGMGAALRRAKSNPAVV